MLDRVVAKVARYPHMDRFEQVHDLFVLVTPLMVEKGLDTL